MRVHDNNVVISELYISLILLSSEPAGQEKTCVKKETIGKKPDGVGQW